METKTTMQIRALSNHLQYGASVPKEIEEKKWATVDDYEKMLEELRISFCDGRENHNYFVTSKKTCKGVYSKAKYKRHCCFYCQRIDRELNRTRSEGK